MKTVLVLLSLFLLFGCTNTTMVRIVEYGGGGAVGVFTGEVGGCSIYQSKDSDVFADVKVTYTGERCLAEIDIKK